MDKRFIFIVLLILVFVAAVYFIFLFEPKKEVWTTNKGETDVIRLFSIEKGQVISSPLEIKGEARGFWFFEASFPIMLFDSQGNQIPLIPPYIITSEDWMTEDFVPFNAVIEFSEIETETGILVLGKDNPSGLPEYDDSLEIPVRFR